MIFLKMRGRARLYLILQIALESKVCGKDQINLILFRNDLSFLWIYGMSSKLLESEFYSFSKLPETNNSWKTPSNNFGKNLSQININSTSNKKILPKKPKFIEILFTNMSINLKKIFNQLIHKRWKNKENMKKKTFEINLNEDSYPYLNL